MINNIINKIVNNDSIYDVLNWLKGKGTRIVFITIAILIIAVGQEKATDYIAVAISVISLASQLTSSIVAQAKEEYYNLDKKEKM